MCLTINKADHKQAPVRFLPKVASNPITCYKIVNWATGKNPKHKKKKTFKSAYQGFIYELNKTYEISNFTFDSNFKSVSKGMYAFTAINIRGKIKDYGINYVTLECEIPKGANYYLGTDGDIIVNRLKTIRVCTLRDIKLKK